MRKPSIDVACSFEDDDRSTDCAKAKLLLSSERATKRVERERKFKVVNLESDKCQKSFLL